MPFYKRWWNTTVNLLLKFGDWLFLKKVTIQISDLDRIKIYQIARILIRSGNYAGLCSAIRTAYHIHFDVSPAETLGFKTHEVFPELMQYKPSPTYDEYWWPMYYQEPRLEVLEKLIYNLISKNYEQGNQDQVA